MIEGVPTLTLDDGTAVIQLNRPSVHNRMEPEDLDAFDALLSEIERDAALRAVIVTGTGKSFSSGFNIAKLDGSGRGDGTFERVADRLERFRLPTIAALNGGVYGGSTDLALACDFRIGVRGMAMFMPAARLGLHYYPGGMRRYVSRLGLNAAKTLFLLAAKQTDEDLLRIGYLTELVTPDELLPRARELARALAANAPLAVQGMKRCLNDIARGDADDTAMIQSAKRCAASDDLREGQAAWLEKRTPNFRGV